MMWLLPILGIILIVAFIVYMNTQQNTGNSHPLTRNRDRSDLHKDAPGYKSYGKLEKPEIAEEEEVRRYPFKGTGTLTTEPVYLDSGVYYLVCQFPDDAKITVDLLNEEGGLIKTITTIAGFNSVSFSIKTARKYAFHVQPERDAVQWALLVKPL